MLHHPSQQQFDELVHEKIITNCPVTQVNVTNAYKLFRPDLAGLKER